jgi:hypothetical protein
MSAPRDAVVGAPVPGRTAYRLRVEGLLDEIAFGYIDDLTLALAFAPPRGRSPL